MGETIGIIIGTISFQPCSIFVKKHTKKCILHCKTYLSLSEVRRCTLMLLSQGTIRYSSRLLPD